MKTFIVAAIAAYAVATDTSLQQDNLVADKTEDANAYSGLRDEMASVVKNWDANGDGKVSASEFL